MEFILLKVTFRAHLFIGEFDGASDNAQTCCPWGWGFWQIADGTLAPTTGGMASFKWDFGYQRCFR